ncbi:MAG: hypothetical protein P0Y49_17140 [Candidatus Pedobacter colombiensis]|uniref:Uncharacterized protein n=1 Tax=Candidatus Pedobacter colombiensis TaxID=3121371 RepID=A0AAJ5W5U6_9SPHI|nr:hypothetical protein [Pedobacter sp.]WEK18517.1 MAG: hypothetical protein P0Y49_17140 [Pedobacter sp.]
MRKLILLLLCTATLGLASCKKDTIIDAGLPNQTIETVINASQWVSVDNGTRLTTTLNFPEIDYQTFKNDGISVYFYPNNSVNEYKQLPYVYDAVSYTYTARQGSITFDIQTSGDINLRPSRPTAPIGVRVVIVTSHLN